MPDPEPRPSAETIAEIDRIASEHRYGVPEVVPDLDDGRHFTEREPWETWDGSYQQAYLRGYTDAEKHPMPVIDGDEMPHVTLFNAWAVLGGYLQQARDDGTTVDPADALSVMVEVKNETYKAVHDWWERHRGPSGYPIASEKELPMDEFDGDGQY